MLLYKAPMDNLKKYEDLLPERITVHIKKTEEGFYAKILELENCYTQADSFVELVEMINDAVFSYLDIPEEHQEKLGLYLPAKVVEEIKRQMLQKAFRDFLKDDSLNNAPSIFMRVRDAV